MILEKKKTVESNVEILHLLKVREDTTQFEFKKKCFILGESTRKRAIYTEGLFVLSRITLFKSVLSKVWPAIAQNMACNICMDIT